MQKGRGQGRSPATNSASGWQRILEKAVQTIAAETGLAHRPVADGERISGVYRRSVMLASGRFAMIAEGMGPCLVPWKPVVEPSLAQLIARCFTRLPSGSAGLLPRERF
ncbi:MAG: DUF3363 domain-containing protein [Pseudogulbenkiania sp.]|nr:DUF3363 domain-containing protein [Pseudogulbenkiania sp.]